MVSSSDWVRLRRLTPTARSGPSAQTRVEGCTFSNAFCRRISRISIFDLFSSTGASFVMRNSLNCKETCFCPRKVLERMENATSNVLPVSGKSSPAPPHHSRLAVFPFASSTFRRRCSLALPSVVADFKVTLRAAKVN